MPNRYLALAGKPEVLHMIMARLELLGAEEALALAGQLDSKESGCVSWQSSYI